MKGSESFSKPVRVAVFLELEISIGGGYQQALNAALLIKNIDSAICEPVFISSVKDNICILRSYGIEAHYFPLRLATKLGLRFRRMLSEPALRVISRLFGPNSLD